MATGVPAGSLADRWACAVGEYVMPRLGLGRSVTHPARSRLTPINARDPRDEQELAVNIGMDQDPDGTGLGGGWSDPGGLGSSPTLSLSLALVLLTVSSRCLRRST